MMAVLLEPILLPPGVEATNTMFLEGKSKSLLSGTVSKY